MIWTTSLTRPRPEAADVLWPPLGRLFHGNLPVRLRAWDGSEIGPPDRPVLIVRNRQALQRLLWQPRELGLARAYVAGELDVEGDLTDCLRLVRRAARDHLLTGGRLSPSGWLGAVRAAVRLGVVGLPPEPPASEVRISARSRSGRRDQAALRGQYDVRPEFCQLILGPQLACSAALWAPDSPDLADAQEARLDAICARLRLQPGMRLLDVGCGWGALAIHAARDYGALVTAVTLSGEQAAFAERRAAELGLGSQLTVRVQDYREISVLPQDAVAVETGEQVGGPDFAAFCDQLRGQLRPGGRLLIQQMSHGAVASGGGAFVERYIAPDLHMRPVGETTSQLEQAGFEISNVRSLRRDCTRTVRAWQRNLDRRWEDAVVMAGVEPARVWRLCLAGLALGFEEGRTSVHQVLAAPRIASVADLRPTSTRAGSLRRAGTRTADADLADLRTGSIAAAATNSGTRPGTGPASTRPADPNPADTDPADTDPTETSLNGASPASARAASSLAGGTRPGSMRPAGLHAVGPRPVGAHAATAHPVGAAQWLLAELVPRQHRADPRRAGQAQARFG